MAINFPNSPTNGQSFSSGGKTYVYNSTSGVWDRKTTAIATVTDVSELTDTTNVIPADISDLTDTGGVLGTGGATVYADMAALIAATGMSNGDLGLVSANNNVYIYNGTGWYKIATVQNDSPSAITGVNGVYNLATDGTATVITAVSTDPEGFPLTWTYSTSGLGSIATVGQADNVFTITPSTDSANAGTFTLTLNVTDGVNGAVSANTSITLLFGINYQVISQDSYQHAALGTNRTTGDSRTFMCFSSPNYLYTWGNNSGFSGHRITRIPVDSTGAMTGGSSTITIAGTSGELHGVAFYDNGNYAWIRSNASSGDYVKYDMSGAPYDLTTATATATTATLTGTGTTQSFNEFRNNGQYLFVGGKGGAIKRYTLTTPYDLTTVTNSGAPDQTQTGHGAHYIGLAISQDGKYIMATEDWNRYAYIHYLNTPYDLTSLNTWGRNTYDAVETLTTAGSTGYNAFGWSFDGKATYYIDWDASGTVKAISLPRPYNFTGHQKLNSLTHSSGTNLRAGTISSDGTKLYTGEVGTGTIREWTLSTAYDLSTASLINTASSVAPTNLLHLQISHDGSKVITSDSNNIYTFSMSTPYDISSVNWTATSTLSLPTNTEATFGFNTTGTILLVQFPNTFTLYQYSLTTPYDLSTATTAINVNVGTSKSAPRFNGTGDRLHMLDFGTPYIREWDLSTAFDISTATLSTRKFDTRSLEAAASRTFEFHPDGSKFFLWGVSSGTVYSVDNSGWET